MKMKRSMLLGLTAIVVVASMGSVGAGSAAATETALCNSQTTNASGQLAECKDQHLWQAGTEIHAVSETFLIIQIPNLGTVECPESTILATTEKTTAKPLPANLAALTFGPAGKCGESTVTTVELGKLNIENIDLPAATHNGTLTFTGTKIKTVRFGLECLYALEHAGTLTGGAEKEQGTIDLSGTLKKVGGSLFCPSQNVKILGFYKVTSPFALWVAT
jgi:hypothetical protein